MCWVSDNAPGSVWLAAFSVKTFRFGLVFMKRLLIAAAMVAMASGLIARADTVGTKETFDLTVDGCSGGCSSTSTVFGTITLVQSAAGVVTVTETLNSPSAFVGTGAGNSLVFSINGDPTITIGSLTSGFLVNTATSTKDSPFADGDYSITCDGPSHLSCGPGASTTNPGPLSFTVTDGAGVNVSDFVAVDTCYKPTPSSTCEAIYFSSDIIGPSGKTGDVGALIGTTTMPSVPEPSSLALLGTGALGFAGVLRRKFRRS